MIIEQEKSEMSSMLQRIESKFNSTAEKLKIEITTQRDKYEKTITKLNTQIEDYQSKNSQLNSYIKRYDQEQSKLQEMVKMDLQKFILS